MHISTDKFDDRAREAIGNTQLQGGLFIIGKIFTAMRDHALAQMPEFEALRDQARDIKKHTLENLDTYLLQFEERVAEMAGVCIGRGTGTRPTVLSRSFAGRQRQRPSSSRNLW